LDDGFVDLCRPKRQMPSSLPALWVLVVLAAVGHRRVDLVCFLSEKLTHIHGTNGILTNIYHEKSSKATIQREVN